MIHMKEQEQGYGVIAHEAMPIEKLPSEEIKKGMRDKLKTLSVKEPDTIFCIVVIRVDSLDGTHTGNFPSPYSFGEWTELNDIAHAAVISHSVQCQLIKQIGETK
jgi:hypothetical protein